MLMMERIRLNSLPACLYRLLDLAPITGHADDQQAAWSMETRPFRSTSLRLDLDHIQLDTIAVKQCRGWDEHSGTQANPKPKPTDSHGRDGNCVCAFLPFCRSPFSNTFSVVRS